MYPYFVELVKILKEKFKAIPIIAGGPHPTVLPEQALNENPGLDYIVVGEGEITILELLDGISGKKDLAQIEGIAYREEGQIKVTLRRPLIEDLDSLPRIAYHLFDMEKYIPAPDSYRRFPATHMMRSRGCPFNCIYCSNKTMFGRKVRTHSVERVVSDISFLKEHYNIKEIFFWDDIFTVNRKWVEEFCEKIKKEAPISWSCNTRVDMVDEVLLKKMKQASCWQIHFGIESGNQRLLDLIKKQITLDQVEQAMRLTRKVGIQTRAYYMLGLPTETPQESLESIRFIKRIRPSYSMVGLASPYPGTEFAQMVKDEIEDISWDNYAVIGGFTGKQRPYVPKGRSSEELNRLQVKAFRSFYLDPRTMLRHLWNMKTPSEFKRHLRGFFALLAAGPRKDDK